LSKHRSSVDYWWSPQMASSLAVWAVLLATASVLLIQGKNI